MTAEVEEWVVEEMAESHDDKDKAERDESIARAQTDDHHRSGNEFE